MLYLFAPCTYLRTMIRKAMPIVCAVAITFIVSAGTLAAQLSLDVNPGSSVRTRQDLEGLLEQYEQVLLSPVYSESVKESTRAKARRVRERLTEGDFRLGDRVVLSVEGEPDLPDTIAVSAGPMLSLPPFGDIPLAGVLRSEIGAHLTEALRQYIREPVVRAQGLMRFSVQGAVGQPGFYVLPADMLLGEVLMAAGGLAANAKLEDMRIERGTQIVMEREELQEAVRAGFTLDQLNLQAGDQVVVPAQSAGSFFGTFAVIVGLFGTVTILILQLSR